MPTLEIHPDLMPFLCKKAEEEGKSITDIIDDILRSLLTNGTGKQTISTCHNCKSPIDYEITDNKGYCDYCECVVFIDKC